MNTTHDNVEVAHKSDAVFIAVKPSHVSKVAAEIAPAIRREHLIISIALGITLRYIETVNKLDFQYWEIRLVVAGKGSSSQSNAEYSSRSECRGFSL